MEKRYERYHINLVYTSFTETDFWLSAGEKKKIHFDKMACIVI